MATYHHISGTIGLSEHTHGDPLLDLSTCCLHTRLCLGLLLPRDRQLALELLTDFCPHLASRDPACLADAVIITLLPKVLEKQKCISISTSPSENLRCKISDSTMLRFLSKLCNAFCPGLVTSQLQRGNFVQDVVPNPGCTTKLLHNYQITFAKLSRPNQCYLQPAELDSGLIFRTTASNLN